MLKKIAKVEEEIRDLRKDLHGLRSDMNEDFRRHDEEESAKTRKSIEDLRKETQKLFKQMDKRQRYIVALMRKMSLFLDEEARDVLKHRLKNRGLKLLRMSRLELQDIERLIYMVRAVGTA
ncbi:MAG: hypothetical protein QXN86_02245 [Candidatus Methanomethylicaceae archaeon]